MKFICPSCHKETKIEVVITGVTCCQQIIEGRNGSSYRSDVYLSNEDNEVTDHYQCYDCGYCLPIKPNPYDDDKLLEWLRAQPYNKEK